MYEEILVPTDGSPAAETAFDHAFEFASTYGARIHALYVIDTASYASLDTGSGIVLDALEQEGTQAIATVEKRGEERGVEVVSTIEQGTPHDRIIDYAGEHDVDLIVMGTHGRRGLERYLLGSVTERVVRSAPVPVMTIRQRTETSEE